MAQTAGRVNIVVTDEKWVYQYDGTRVEGDGSSGIDVDPKEAANAALAGIIVTTTDVKILASDYVDAIRSIQNKYRP